MKPAKRIKIDFKERIFIENHKYIPSNKEGFMILDINDNNYLDKPLQYEFSEKYITIDYFTNVFYDGYCPILYFTFNNIKSIQIWTDNDND